jgi:hypothetical protein
VWLSRHLCWVRRGQKSIRLRSQLGLIRVIAPAVWPVHGEFVIRTAWAGGPQLSSRMSKAFPPTPIPSLDGNNAPQKTPRTTRGEKAPEFGNRPFSGSAIRFARICEFAMDRGMQGDFAEIPNCKGKTSSHPAASFRTAVAICCRRAAHLSGLRGSDTGNRRKSPLRQCTRTRR